MGRGFKFVRLMLPVGMLARPGSLPGWSRLQPTGRYAVVCVPCRRLEGKLRLSRPNHPYCTSGAHGGADVECLVLEAFECPSCRQYLVYRSPPGRGVECETGIGPGDHKPGPDLIVTRGGDYKWIGGGG